MFSSVKNLCIYPFQTTFAYIIQPELTKVCDMNKAVIMIPGQGTNKGLRKSTQYRSKLEWCQLERSDSGL